MSSGSQTVRPGSYAEMKSSDVHGRDINMGKQDDNNHHKCGDLIKNVPGNVIKNVRRFSHAGRDLIVNNWVRGRSGLPCGLPCVLLIGGVVIAVVLIAAAVLILKHSHDGKVAGQVDVDASLSATADNSSSWPSPSGVFAFGFRQLENNDGFLLCIWFANISDRTIVWYANGDRPAPNGSTVKLIAESGLVLRSPQGERLWNQSIAGVARGVMLDTGNFVLQDDKSESLWETFKNPTDTMLPGQTIERGGKLFSRTSETNYTRGRFQLEFQEEDGNLVFSEGRAFCSTRTTRGKVDGSEGAKLVFNTSGIFYILRVNNGYFKFTHMERLANAFYLRSTLDFNGVLAQYYLPKSNVNGSWAQLWFEPHQFDSRADDCARNCSNCYLDALEERPRPPCC